MYLRLVLSIFVLNILVGCGTGTGGNGTIANLELAVSDQETAFYTRLKIDKVDVDQPVFLVIHDSFINGRINRVLYTQLLSAGVDSDFAVTLNKAIDIQNPHDYSDLFHAAFYMDTDANGEFDIEIDELAVDRVGNSISQSFTVTAKPETVHAIINIASDQGVAFDWTKQTDDLDGFSTDADNTDGIILNAGWRYKVVNNDANSVLRFLDEDGQVFEEQASSNNVFYFTVDSDFEAAVTQYDGGANSPIGGQVSFK